MIKLLATDLDGTLLNEQGQIYEEDIAALRRAREMGVTIVVATGRMPATLNPYLDRLEVTADEPVVGGHGAVIALRNGDVLHSFTIPHETIAEGAAIARKFDAVPTLYTAHAIYMERVAFSPEQDEYWLAGGIPIRYDPDALAHIDEALIKMLVVQPDVPAVPALLEALRSHLGDRAEVVRSHQWFVEVMNKDASKGAAIAWLAKQRGIGPDEVLAIGDAENDVSMLRWAGHSAAPANAAPEALAAAKWIAPPQHERAVAATLERFLFRY
jgi:Cof subfamily protein (haloacid dehalogenase superfamily)